MTPVAGERGVYQATYETTHTGIFRFEAAAKSGDEKLGNARFAVRREDGVLEHYHTQQNRALLERLAAATGGNYFTLDDVGKLPEAVSFSDAGSVERTVLDLWNMPIIFLALLLAQEPASGCCASSGGGCEREREHEHPPGVAGDFGRAPEGCLPGDAKTPSLGLAAHIPVRRRPGKHPSARSRNRVRVRECSCSRSRSQRRGRAPAHAELYYFIVGGLGGEAKYQEQFDKQVKRPRGRRAPHHRRCARHRAHGRGRDARGDREELSGR